MADPKNPQKINSFTQLHTWQQARVLTGNIYRLTYTFPEDEKFGLTSQIRRSCISVTANIAEGFSRATVLDKRYFYTIALGSLTETLSHIYIAYDLGFISSDHVKKLEKDTEQIKNNIEWLIKTARKKIV